MNGNGSKAGSESREQGGREEKESKSSADARVTEAAGKANRARERLESEEMSGRERRERKRTDSDRK